MIRGHAIFSDTERPLLIKHGFFGHYAPMTKSKGTPLRFPRISSAPFRTRVALLFSTGFISYLPSCAHASPPPFSLPSSVLCAKRGWASCRVNVRAHNEQHPLFSNLRRQHMHVHTPSFFLAPPSSAMEALLFFFFWHPFYHLITRWVHVP